MPGLTKCCTCHAKSPSQRWRSDAPKCNLSQEISALISYRIYLMCLLHYAYHAKCIFLDPLQMSHACHRFWNCHKTLMFCSLLTRCTIPCACHAKRHLNVQKRSVPHSFWHYWLRNVLRATTACTFWTSQTSKSGPSMVCFVHFDLDMCFAPQRRALFRHLNFQMWSDPGVLCTFWLCNVLRATTACNFSSLIWPAGSAPAALASLLFDPPEPQIIGKTQCFATFLPFRAPGSPFFWKFLLVDLLSSSLLFSDSSHLCVSSVHIVGSLSSKLRSMMRSSWVCFRTEAVTRHQGSACVDSGAGASLRSMDRHKVWVSHSGKSMEKSWNENPTFSTRPRDSHISSPDVFLSPALEGAKEETETKDSKPAKRDRDSSSSTEYDAFATGT